MDARRRARPTGPVLLAVLLLLAACSENFGTPPDPTGRGSVDVVEEGVVGPVDPTARPGAVAGSDRVWFVALATRGTWRLDPADDRWRPGPPALGFRRVTHVDVADGGDLWMAGDGAALFGSVDGGEVFEDLGSPAAGSPLGLLAALPSSPARPGGAWLAGVGLTLHRRDVAGGGWVAVDLPAPPAGLGPVAADGAGRVLVAARLPSGVRLWRSEDGALTFHDAGPLGAEMPLALGLDAAGGALWVDGTGVFREGTRVEGWPAGLEAADWAPGGHLLATSGDTIWWGRVGEAVERQTAPFEPDPARGLGAAAGGGLVVGSEGLPWILQAGEWKAFPLGGGPLSMGAVAVDPRRPGRVLLAGGARGRVWEGPVQGPFTERGIPYQPSVQSLLPDPRRDGGLFAATYGVQYQASPTAAWEQRNDGQSSYLCDAGFGGPVVPHTLAFDPLGEALWLGAINGDGPYRSLDGGLHWQAMHQNLGPLGDCLESSGLRRISQARAFAFSGGTTWMAGFQGGVWRWEAEGGFWRGVNRGLPDVFGSVVDTCCVSPFDLAVDVRDMAVLADGTLLAATGWGIYRDPTGEGAWESSSGGLGNFDVWRLAVHPTDSRWILAGCSGKVASPGWLYLSADGGRSWSEVGSTLRARRVTGLVWSDPSVLEAVALLEWSGAWRLRLRP